MEQPSPTHAASRLREYRLTEDVQLRVEAHKASLHTAHETLRNPRLIRVPAESSSCIADGLLGVEPGAGSWSLRQTHCAGARIYSEELVFTLPASGQPATLVRFEVTCIDRYAANQDGVTASLSHAKLGGLTFEDVDLATLYDQLDLSACDRDP